MCDWIDLDVLSHTASELTDDVTLWSFLCSSLQSTLNYICCREYENPAVRTRGRSNAMNEVEDVPPGYL